MAGPTIHKFRHSGDAYNMTQTDESIRHGDTLVIKSEGVVGMLMKAWPVAVTENVGAFHTYKPGVDARGDFTPEQIELAVTTARNLGLPVRDAFRMES